MTDAQRWPTIPVASWRDTRDTLQLYTQVVGKVRLANEPLNNHWWNVPLYLTARGLTTMAMPHPTGPTFQIDLDFIDHRLEIVTTTGGRQSLPLEPRSVADFHDEVMRLLDELGVGTATWSMPVEIPAPSPSPTIVPMPATTLMRSGASGSRSSRCSGCSRSSALVSSARRARSTCSGEPSTSPIRGSRGDRRPRTRAAHRTAGPT